MKFHTVAGQQRFGIISLLALLALLAAASIVTAGDGTTVSPPVECPPPPVALCADSTLAPLPPDPGTTSVDPGSMLNLLASILGVI